MKFKSISQFLAFAAVLVVGYGLSWVVGLIFGEDFNAYFAYMALRSESSNNIVIVAIDNASLDALSKSDFRVFNFSKSTYVDLIERLEKEWARAIGLDIVLSNPDPKEADLAKILDTYKNVVIAAKVGSFGEERILPRAAYPREFWWMINVIAKKNIVNRIMPVRDLDGKGIEAFSIQVYRKWIRDTGTVGKIVDGFYEINPTRKIPVGSDSAAYIPFLRRSGEYPKEGYQKEEYPKISLIDVLNGKYPAWFFKDKAVLIGEYGTFIHDEHYSPVEVSKKMPGIEFHANMLDSLFRNVTLRPLDTWVSNGILAMVTFATFCVVAYASVPVIVLVFLLLPIVVIMASWYLMAAHGILLDVWIFVFVAGISSLIGGSIYRYFVVDASRRFLSNAFGHYISPEIVKQIAANPESFSLGGQRRDLTVFFSDIAGFSGISEQLNTDELFKLMNEYLSEMTEILVRNNGTLDKYIGDSVMGFYGAPLPLERGSYWACKTALEQQDRLVTLNKKWSANRIPKILTRIGIHSGEVMVGNIGSTDRFNYTVMGDNVNLASRLEGVNKEYETLVCVSAQVAAEAGSDDFVFRRLDRIRVKGKEESVEIFELVGFAHDHSVAMDEKLRRIAAYEKALGHYFAGDFALARELFRQYPDDPPASIMSTRCVSLIAGTTRLKDGVFVFSYK